MESRAVTQAFEPTEENGRRSVKPVVWSVDLEECAKEYHAFAKETENCAEMGDTVDVTNAIKRYAKFMLLQNRHKDELLVPPFDVKVVWLAHMIRVEMYRKDCEAAFGRVIDCHVLEPTFRTKAHLAITQERWKAAFGSGLVFEYQPSARRVNIPATGLDGRNFTPSITVKDVQADRAWLPMLEGSVRNFTLTDTFVANAKRAYDMYMHLLHKEVNCELGPPVAVDLILVGRIPMHSPWPTENITLERVEMLFTVEYGAAMAEVVAGISHVSVDPNQGCVKSVEPAPTEPLVPPPRPPPVPHPPCGLSLPDLPPPPPPACGLRPPVPRPTPMRPACSMPPPRPPVMCRIRPPQPVVPNGVAACVRDGVCTYAATGEKFAKQRQAYYQCNTCGYGQGLGLCASCLTKCHRGHDVSVASNIDCFCDCGAGAAPGACCQAMDWSGKYTELGAPNVPVRPPVAR